MFSVFSFLERASEVPYGWRKVHGPNCDD